MCKRAPVHDAVAGELQVFRMADDRQIKGAGVFQGPAHELGIAHRPAVVGQGHGPGLFQFAVFRQDLPFGALGQGCHGVDSRALGLGRLFQDVAGDHGSIVDRQGVGHAGHCGESSGQGRLAPGSDGFFVFLSRLPEMGMHVDEPRTDKAAADIHDPVARIRQRLRRPESRHPSCFNEQLTALHPV